MALRPSTSETWTGDSQVCFELAVELPTTPQKRSLLQQQTTTSLTLTLTLTTAPRTPLSAGPASFPGADSAHARRQGCGCTPLARKDKALCPCSPPPLARRASPAPRATAATRSSEPRGAAPADPSAPSALDPPLSVTSHHVLLVSNHCVPVSLSFSSSCFPFLFFAILLLHRSWCFC